MPPSLPEASRVLHKDAAGDLVEVRMFVQYPSYDFIYGNPTADSPKYAKEAVYFEYRDSRAGGKSFSLYLDVQEATEFIRGVGACLEVAADKAPHLWG